MAHSTIQLCKTNNELQKRLTGSNAAIMTDMVVYLRVSSLSEQQIEQIRHDLLEWRLLLRREAKTSLT
ncbi:hypothetical protein [Paenibacillus xylaniclasticus]|uniref:hypothetical protein n=1 Tax=Paenibacillus xylaniclasticus TaxID=588083 RepID=UPI000FD9C88C|nr:MULTISPECIES: hypothetical protein [Paenibacillus]GFN32927.1 hypothetical protein PCURB6_31870 [Paenibacillus curdlanolyticus]